MVWENSVELVLLAFFSFLVVGIFLILKLTKNKARKISNLRFFVQTAAVVAIFMGLITGPFNTPLYAPLGISPRDRLVGADTFGNQFPDGLSVPV